MPEPDPGPVSGATTSDRRLLIVLHGYGDDPAGLARRFAPLVASRPGWDLLTPRGAFGSMAEPTWFGSDEHGPVEADLVSTLDALDDVIDAAGRTSGIARRHVAVIGFSQGGAVALALALRASGPEAAVGGAGCLGGWLAHASSVGYRPESLVATPVLIAHGVDDDVVAVQQGRSAARYLERQGVPVELVETPGDHAVDDEMMAAVGRWLDLVTGA